MSEIVCSEEIRKQDLKLCLLMPVVVVLSSSGNIIIFSLTSVSLGK